MKFYTCVLPYKGSLLVRGVNHDGSHKKFKVNYSSFNCDVTNYNHLKSFISKLTKLDILVNNAGTNIPESFLYVKKTSMEKLLNVNTKAVFNVAQLCANQIIKIKRKSGSIINIS